MGLTTFIVLGLLMMFNQTQRAFRTSMTQTDVLEGGRATMDLLTRELDQAAPTESPDLRIGRTAVPIRTTNFFIEPSPYFVNPLVQELPGSGLARTNTVERFFFMSHFNQDWIGTGYQVIPEGSNNCVGTLYRFSMTNYPRSSPIQVSRVFVPNLPVTNMTRIADGIVHFRVRPFDTRGLIISPTNSPRNTFVYWRTTDRQPIEWYFVSNAVPAAVEIELGILEQQILQRYRSIPDATAQRQYLSNHVAQVHVFRQLIPIRNTDFSAYQ